MVYIPPLMPWARARQKTAKRLFADCMERARDPVFFVDMGVPDTFDGRFEMISMLVASLVNRLNQEGASGQKLAQSLFDVMFLDLELACRESGIGDLSIPRHMKRMMAGFNGRLNAYAEQDLTNAVRNNIYGTLEEVDQKYINLMVHYMKTMREGLNRLSYQDIIADNFQLSESKGMNDETRQTA
jgi:cytochrome b pre-mRNA-processing protein 3